MTERLIETHKGGFVNDALRIEAIGEPTAGGSNHTYWIHSTEPRREDQSPAVAEILKFQNGNPRHGINGITNEALLAVVEDRLAAFQRGPFACLSNEQALLCVRTALAALKTRTAERIARGVEGEAKP